MLFALFPNTIIHAPLLPNFPLDSDYFSGLGRHGGGGLLGNLPLARHPVAFTLHRGNPLPLLQRHHLHNAEWNILKILSKKVI